MGGVVLCRQEGRSRRDPLAACQARYCLLYRIAPWVVGGCVTVSCVEIFASVGSAWQVCTFYVA